MAIYLNVLCSLMKDRICCNIYGNLVITPQFHRIITLKSHFIQDFFTHINSQVVWAIVMYYASALDLATTFFLTFPRYQITSKEYTISCGRLLIHWTFGPIWIRKCPRLYMPISWCIIPFPRAFFKYLTMWISVSQWVSVGGDINWLTTLIGKAIACLLIIK